MRSVKRQALPPAVSIGMPCCRRARAGSPLCMPALSAGLTIRNQAVLRNAYIEPQLQSDSGRRRIMQTHHLYGSWSCSA
jgi:hypothetical protein